MREHVTEWLGAYMDGELQGLQRCQVESHLVDCQACQAELEDLRELSSLLHAADPVKEFIPADRFTAQLALRLPRRPEVPLRKKALEIGWWLIPAGILGAWVFVQVLLLMSGVVSTAGQAGLLGRAAAWFPTGPQHGAWMSSIASLLDLNLNESGNLILQTLDQIELFGTDILVPVIWQAVLGFVYVSWLLLWWMRSPRNNSIPLIDQ
jgi:hypothetical protein